MKNGNNVAVPLQHVLHIGILKRRHLLPSQHVRNNIQQHQAPWGQCGCHAWPIESPQYQSVQLNRIVLRLIPCVMFLARHDGVVDHFLPLPFRYVLEGIRDMDLLPVRGREPSPGARLERDHANIVLNGCIQYPLPHASVMIRSKVDREHARVHQAALDHPNRHGFGMGRESDGTDPTLAPGTHERFHRPSLSQYSIHVFLRADGMELVQIQAIRSQRPQRVAQIRGRSRRVPVHGLSR
mmetsp:Transcript_35057/g.84608  ORF Transcript_35057/g.84608 Transcript_35057/m.84608 type:complete len:239 (+) Transcript_35057:181-897(+)